MNGHVLRHQCAPVGSVNRGQATGKKGRPRKPVPLFELQPFEQRVLIGSMLSPAGNLATAAAGAALFMAATSQALAPQIAAATDTTGTDASTDPLPQAEPDTQAPSGGSTSDETSPIDPEGAASDELAPEPATEAGTDAETADTGASSLSMVLSGGSLDAAWMLGAGEVTDPSGTDVASANQDPLAEIPIPGESSGELLEPSGGPMQVFEPENGASSYTSGSGLVPTFPKITTSFGSASSSAHAAIAQQSDGKIVAAGDYNSHVALARYEADGALDTSFGTGGKVTTIVPGTANSVADAVAIQNDGKIVIVGRATQTQGGPIILVARYTSAGVLDTSFSGDGINTYAVGSISWAWDLAIDSNGKIVAAGTAISGPTNVVVVVRVNTNGTPDTSFGSGGVVTTSFGSYPQYQGAEALGVAIQPVTNKIIISGYAGGDFLAVRYSTSGSLDNSFDTDGKKTIDMGGSDRAEELVIDPGPTGAESDDKIILGGTTGSDMAVARLGNTGALDTSLDSDGKKIIDFAGGSDGAKSVGLQTDGKIILGGYAGGGASGDDFALVRLNGGGSFDTGFDGDGKLRIDYNGLADRALGMVQRDEDVVLAGYATRSGGTYTDFALAGYNIGAGPTVTISGPATAAEGAEVTYTSTVTDNATPPLVYSWLLLREGLPVALPPETVTDGSTFTFAVPDDGSYIVELTVSNAAAEATTVQRWLTGTNIAPTLTLSGATAVDAGAPFTLNLGVDEPGDDTITGWTIDWGDEDDPQIVSGSPSAVDHTYAFATGNEPNTYTITASADDEDGTYSANSFAVHVSPWKPVGLTVTPLGQTSVRLDWVDASNNETGYIIEKSTDGTSFTQVVELGVGADTYVATDLDPATAYYFRVKAKGEADGVDSAYSTVSVTSTASPAVVSGATSVGEGASYTLSLSSALAGTTGWTIDWGDGSGVQDIAGNPISVGHVYSDDAATRTILSSVTDGTVTYDADPLTISVQNVAPTVTIGGSGTVDEGSSYTLTLAADDRGNDSVNQWHIDWGDGSDLQIVSGNPGSLVHTYADGPGSYTVSATAIDEDGGARSNSHVVSVQNLAPDVPVLPDQQATAGQGMNVSFTFSDAGVGDTHIATIDWGDGSSQSFFPSPSGGDWMVTAGHVYAAGGDYTATASVRDSDGGVTARTFAVTVQGEGPPPPPGGSGSGSTYLISSEGTLNGWFWAEHGGSSTGKGSVELVGDDIRMIEGDSFSVELWRDFLVPEGIDELLFPYSNIVFDQTGNAGSINDAFEVALLNPITGAALVPTIGEGRTVFLNHSDGQDEALASGVTDTLGDVHVDLSQVAAESTARILFRLLNEDADTTSQVFVSATRQVRIAGASTTPEGSEYSLVLDNGGPGAVGSWTIDWGDGIQSSAGTSDTLATHTYADGTIARTITAAFEGLESNELITTVQNVAPTLVIGGLAMVEQGALFTLDLRWSDPGPDTITQVQVNWGDGDMQTIETGMASPMVLTHTYQVGPADRTIIVSGFDEDDGPYYSNTHNVHVDNPGPVVQVDPSTGVEGSDITLTGTFSDPGQTSGHSATVWWGDGTSSPATLTGYDISASHIYADNGTYAIRVDVNDGQQTGSDSNIATVGNAAPNLDAGLSFQTQTIAGVRQMAAVVSGDFTDAGFTRISAGTSETFTLLIDWGDGQVEAVTPAVSNGGTGIDTAGEFTASHSYTQSGMYEVTVTVTDDDSGTDSVQFASFRTIRIDVTRTINLKSQGEIPVKIFDEPGFGTDLIDESSLRFGPAGAFLSGTLSPGNFGASAHRMGHFDVQDSGIRPTDTEVYLTGQLDDETWFVGFDAITIAPGSDEGRVGVIPEGSVPKFFVADPTSDNAHRYDASGEDAGYFPLETRLTEVRGIAANSSGALVWSIDGATGQVAVQGPTGAFQGSWVALDEQSLSLAQITGIATDGADVWVVDASTDRVYRYAEAGLQVSGLAIATSSFALYAGNLSPSDLTTTDGSRLWVTDDQSDSVYVYSPAGVLLGSWQLDAANADASGITGTPGGGGSDLWVVDRVDGVVYRYADATGWTAGAQSATDSFALSASNSLPEGIADPLPLTPSTVADDAREPDTYGTDFWIPFGPWKPHLLLRAERPTHVRVLIYQDNPPPTPPPPPASPPPLVLERDVVPGKTEIVPIELPIEPDSGIVHVVAEDEVAVQYVTGESAWGYTALPTDILGTDYMAMTWGGYAGVDSGSSRLVITATADATSVTVVPSTDAIVDTSGVTSSVSSGQAFTVVLDRGKRLYVASQLDGGLKNLTGTTVRSDKPIAVISEHSSRVPIGAGGSGGVMVEQLPAIEYWGREFVTAPHLGRNRGERLRILAAYDGTEVEIHGSHSTANRILGAGEFYDHYDEADTWVHVAADRPVLVGQFSQSSSFDGTDGQPTLMFVPATTQYRAQHQFSSTPVPWKVDVHFYGSWRPDLELVDHYITISAPNSAVASDSIVLDGKAIARDEFTAVTDTGFSVARFPFSNDAEHSLKAPVPIGAWVYGFYEEGDYWSSYATVPGMSFAVDPVVTTIQLDTQLSARTVGWTHSLQATLLRDGRPVEGANISFAVSGAHITAGTGTTNASGIATFTYLGNSPGTDTVTATLGALRDSSTVTWSSPAAPTLQIITPTAGSVYEPGRTITITGKAQAGMPELPVTSVTVNGQPVDGIDRAGNFWYQHTMTLGDNVLTFQASDGRSSSMPIIYTLSGVGTGADITPIYGRTTYADDSSDLFVDLAIRNTGAAPVAAPIRLYIDQLTSGVTVANPTGTTVQGVAYIDFDSELVVGGSLDVQETSQFRPVRFHNPDKIRFTYQTWAATAPTEAAPVFSTVPIVPAEAGGNYGYDADAFDPDEDMPLRYSLVDGPTGDPGTTADDLTVDLQTGLVSWTPRIADRGDHDVTIRVTDFEGDWAEQTYVLRVTAPAGTRPPLIITQPLYTPIFPSQDYVYELRAYDPDPGEMLTWTKLTGGGELQSNTGEAVVYEWHSGGPGSSQITVQVTDSAGWSDVQSFYVRTYSTGTKGDASPDSAAPGSIAGVVYIDENNNGARDQGEAALSSAGWRVYIDTNQDRSLNAEETIGNVNEFGEYELPDLAPSAYYRLALVPPGSNWTGYSLSSPSTGFLNVSLGEGQPLIERNFGLRPDPDPAADAAPQIQTAAPLIARAGSVYIYRAFATDPDGEAPVYSLDARPDGMMIGTGRGIVVWRPTTSQIGTHVVTVRAKDPTNPALYATQTFTLTVLAGGDTGFDTNQAPLFTSLPPTSARIGVLYTYTLAAMDFEGDQISYSLVGWPDDMTLANGVVQWTPGPAMTEPTAQVQVLALDDRGASTMQTFRINVADAADQDRPPVITSRPVRNARSTRLYTYTVQATDPEGAALAYELLQGPEGMAISTSGVLTWTPESDDPSVVSVTIRVSDGRQAVDQSYLLSITDNHAPTLAVPLEDLAAIGYPYSYRLTPGDEDADPLTFTITGPTGITVNDRGLIEWSSPQLPGGSVSVTVSDGIASVTKSYQLSVGADTMAPIVTIASLGTVQLPGPTGKQEAEVWFYVTARDNTAILPESLTLTIDGEPVALDAYGRGSVVFKTAYNEQNPPPYYDLPNLGPHTLVATAEDIFHNEGTTTETINVVDDDEAPVAAITTPDEDHAAITYITNIEGTATDANLKRWTLTLLDPDDELYSKVLAEGTTNMPDQSTLASLDPTLLPNGLYELELEVIDQLGRMTVVTRPISIAGQAKVGNVRFSETDLVIPVAGIPITLTRSYDSADAERFKDFGYGWSMGLDLQLQESPSDRYDFNVDALDAGYDYGRTRQSLSVRVGGGRDVALTLPDGRRVSFTYEERDLGTGTWQAGFTAEPGVAAKLEIDGPDRIRYYTIGSTQLPYWSHLGPTYGDVFDTSGLAIGDWIAKYDIPGYILTMEDGTRFYFRKTESPETEGVSDPRIYDINDNPYDGIYSYIDHIYDQGPAKLWKIVDPNNNTLTISDDGITATGATGGSPMGEITFIRDWRGRIEEVVNINTGQTVLKYRYDTDEYEGIVTQSPGDLLAVDRLVDGQLVRHRSSIEG
jgi:uncharacterized delta-60 repeat protein